MSSERAQVEINEPCDELRFIAIGDFGSPSPEAHMVAESMAKWSQSIGGIHFVLGLGDNIYPHGVKSVNDKGFRKCWSDIYLCHPELRVPWWLILGNHDYELNPDAQVLFTESPQNPNGLWNLPARNYTFVRSLSDGTRVRFCGLDTNGCHPSIQAMWQHSGIASQVQSHVRNLENELRAHIDNPEWKIVFGHCPLYTAGKTHSFTSDYLREDRFMDWRGTPTSGCGLGKVLERGRVHAYFGGHEHVNQFRMHGDIASFVCGSVADPRFYRGCDEERKRTMDWVDTEGKVGFVAVTITPTEMIVRFVTAPSCEIVQTVRVPCGNGTPSLHSCSGTAVSAPNVERAEEAADQGAEGAKGKGRGKVGRTRRWGGRRDNQPRQGDAQPSPPFSAGVSGREPHVSEHPSRRVTSCQLDQALRHEHEAQGTGEESADDLQNFRR